MSRLLEELEEYLSLRRALGSKLRGPDVRLRRFVAFLECKKSSFVTTALAMEWATQPRDVAGSFQGRCLQEVRLFARYLHAKDSRHQVPPTGLLSTARHRKPPYLYSISEIQALLRAAEELPSSNGLGGATYACVVGLLAVTGMRMGEALALDRKDVDLEQGVLTVRHAKFDKSRLVPLHPSTTKALGVYANRRDSVFPTRRCDAFFVSTTGLRVRADKLHPMFRELRERVGLGRGSGRRPPRLHDLRHRFAAETMLRWYRQGLAATKLLPLLSTYLGHVGVASTYWYLQAVPELLALASQRRKWRFGGRP